MKGNDEGLKKNEAQILAQLRRRSSSPSRPQNDDSTSRPLDSAPEDAFENVPEEASEVPSNNVAAMPLVKGGAKFAEEASEAPSNNVAENVLESVRSEKIADGAANRADALRRSIAIGAPKEPMSALSPTLRNLRNELNSENVVDFSDAPDVDFASSGDASLDLIESELAFARNGRESVADSAANRTASTQNPTTSDEPASLNSKKPLKFSRIVGLPDSNVSDERADREDSSDFGGWSNPQTEPNAKSSPNVQVVQNPQPRQIDASDVKDIVASDLIVASGLKKGYVKANRLIPVLRGVDLTARRGELLAIVGQSGSGKSTLLHLVGTLDVPDEGAIYFDGQRIDNLPTSQRDVLRNRFIGMIFQFYHLIPEMTTLENVLAPLMIRDSVFTYWRNRTKYVAKAKEILGLVGLSHRLRHRPNELSGGEMQRASIARALISEPQILLADEPTGNLDSKTSAGILKLLRKLNEEQKLTIIMVTHDRGQAADADRAIRLIDGLVVPNDELER